MSETFDPRLDLPPGHALERVLSTRPGECVVLALAGERRVVVRSVWDARRLGGELAVLGRIRAPRLAGLLAAGTTPRGGAYLAREWIEGEDLGQLGPLDASAAGALVVEIALALDELHARGFTHGDLKPGNLVRRSDGGIVLTDFGLSVVTRGAQAGGTLGFVAPEVLVGAGASPRADLFSLGVTWLLLLGVVLPPPSQLYGRFPAEPFLAAAGVELGALPADARDLIAELLQRDPLERPATAGAFARRAAARFGLQTTPSELPLEPPPWSHTAGRSEFLAAQLAKVAAEGGAVTWSLPSREEADAFAREAALVHAVRGARVQHVDLAFELRSIGDSVELDRWLARLELRSQRATLITSGQPGAWGGLVATALGELELASGLVHCVGPEAAVAAGALDVPGQGIEAVERQLARALPSTPPSDLHALAETLQVEAGGSSLEAATRVAALFLRGDVVDAGDGARLRPGLDARECVRSRPRVDARAQRALPEGARLILAGLSALGPAPPEVVTEVIDAGAGATHLALLVERGLVEALQMGGQRVVRVRTGSSALDLGIERAARRQLYQRLSEWLLRSERSVEATWAVRYLSGVAGASEQILHEVRALAARRLAARVAAGLEQARALAKAEGEPLALLLARELAFAKVELGDAAGARAEANAFGGSAAARAAKSEVLAWLARVQADYGEAARLYELAGLAVYALEARLQAAFYAGETQRVEDLAQEFFATFVPDDAEPRALAVRIDVLSGATMSALRAGDLDRVRTWMHKGRELAAASDNVAAQGVLALTLGTAARRLGDLRGGLEHYERAVSAYRDLGLAAILAQARLAFAGALRELGRVAESEPLVLEAFGTRRRLGDLPGAATARGMLGLLRAERGHLHAASIELEGAAEALTRFGRMDQAELVYARLKEMRARSGEPVAATELAAQAPAEGPAGAPGKAADPRTLVAHARAAWCSRDIAGAVADLERALAAATGGGRATVADEAQWLLAIARGAPAPATSADASDAASESLLAEDRLLYAALTDTELDGRVVSELARVLVLRGRDDRGARAAIAVAARDTDPVRRERAAALAKSALERVHAGATPEAAAYSERHLLGFPDPWPEDLARWRDQPEDEMDVLTVLGINERLVEQQDLDTLLGAIVDAALEVTGGERGFIALEEHGELSLDRALDSSRGDLAPDEVEYSRSIVRAALERGGPLRIADAGEDVLYGDARSVMTFELRSVMCQAFDVEVGVRGVILVDDRRRPGAFGPREERLLGLLAGQAALAVRQVRRLESIVSLRDELAARVVERETRLEVVERRLEQQGQVPPVEGLIGESEAMRAVHKLLRRVAPSELTVLVSGESGTGKEVAARALHSLSPRVKGPFVAENCAALPASLLESELFGSRKGAFTGSERDREGLFERANGGTLFLDEIGELPLDQQAKLLRVLETREVRRIGDVETRPVDFRLVAATNRDLAVEVQEGRFREDLMYRLDTVRVVMPSVRERLEDVPALVAHFTRLAAARDGRSRAVSPEVLAALAARPWPGNVRELANEVARLLVLSDGDVVDPSLVRAAPATEARGAQDLVRPLEELEREAILAALARTGGDKRKAAELLGISRAKVYQRLKEWHIE
ncbi:MAG: sigma 54-interacting transcriptional regulator [Planctomycetota bacterium]